MDEGFVRYFKTRIHKEDFMVRDHRIHGARVLPGTFLLDLTFRAGSAVGLPPTVTELRSCLFVEPVVVADEEGSELRIGVQPSEGRSLVVAESRSLGHGAPWTKCFSAELMVRDSAECIERLDVASKRQQAFRTVDVEELYAFARRAGIDYREFLRVTGQVYEGHDFILARATLGRLASEHAEDFHVHPTLLDFATLVSLYQFEGGHDAPLEHPFVPMFVESFRSFRPSAASCWVYVQKPPVTGRGDVLRSDVQLFDDDGAPLAVLHSFTAKRVRSVESLTRTAQAPVITPATPVTPVTTNGVSGGAARPVAYAPVPVEPPSAVESVRRELQVLLGELLGERSSRAVDVHEGFYEAGLSSTDLLNVVTRLEERTGKKLYPTLLFEHPSIADLAQYLAEEHPDAYGAPQETRETERVEPAKAPISIPRVERESTSDDIAIVGMAGRYPMAADTDAFWQNLVAGRDCIVEVPAERWDWRENFDSERGTSGRSYSKWGGFVDGHDEFDALFFNISPREAESMDPHERLFLQTAWAALEDAGYTRSQLASDDASVGVFVGVMWTDYQIFGVEENHKNNPVFAESWLAYVANRVSYFLNLRGPSLSLDTACSSSLHALHLACDSLRRGECSAAIVGGVNLSLHPSKYVRLSEVQVLASDGRCRSFGKGGTGYVPGEGVGAVLVKRLTDAVAADDHIYAVVKGSAINHGGRTSGFTVPSPDAQARLILRALEQAKVDPATIGYVEAHGTGTSLGDPIEIAGLTSAFRKSTRATGFCAIGSVKSNIGHLEAAAGMASITKVLLCMKHEMFVPSLHSEELNPSIPFAESPFFLPRAPQRWEGSPRRAGISSFGAGGSNAHVVLEEWKDTRTASGATSGAELILLSAKNEERLRARMKALQAFLAARDGVRLQDVAYTLQVGREAMESRLALVVRSCEELLRALEDQLGGRSARVPVFVGQGRRGSPTFGVDPEDQEYLSSLWRAGKLAKLAALWAEGAAFDGAMFVASRRGVRISLPTYPFAQKRFWMKRDAGSARDVRRSSQPAGLHPLLDANESSFDAYRFRKRLSGNEFFVADHLVRGRRVLPGAAYLEMARAAAAILGGRTVGVLENVSWRSPLTIDEPVDAVIRLESQGGSIRFDIISEHDPEVLHARGHLSFEAARTDVGRLDTHDAITMTELAARCREELDPEAFYEALAARGLVYGPGLRAVQRLRLGPEEAFVELRVPEGLASGVDAFGLHPSLLDGALQAVGALLSRGGAPRATETVVPYAVGSVHCLGLLGPRCFARIVPVPSAEHRFHIDIFDADGQAAVLLRDLVVKPMVTAEPEKEALLFYTPSWRAEPAIANGSVKTLLLLDRGEARADALRARPDARVVLVEPGKAGSAYAARSERAYGIDPANPEHYRALLADLRKTGAVPSAVLHLWNLTGAGTMEESLRTGLGSVFHFTRAFPSLKLRETVPFVYAAGGNDEMPEHASVAGFARSSMLENPKLAIKVVHVADRLATSERLADALLEELAASNDAEVRRDIDTRFIRTFARAAASIPPSGVLPSLLRKGGSYLITGGAGGLGMVFARYLAEHAHARIALVGRSPLDDARAKALDQLRALGGDAIYLCGDITDRTSAERCVRQTLERFGELHGVLHAAGIVEDAFLANKSPESFERVLGPKIAGTVHLDHATRDLPLDVVVLFSSISSVLGNFGQSDYSAGNRFLDAFAGHREALRRAGQRRGRTLSINWPLWREGGMRIHPDVESTILAQLGIRVLETELGLKAFAAACGLEAHQVLAVDADAARFEARMGLHVQPAPHAVPLVRPKSVDVEATVRGEIRALCGGLLKMPEEEIELEVDLGEYGIDSMMVVKLLDGLEARYATSLSPTVIVDYPTIDALARHLVAQPAVLRAVNAAGEQPRPSETPAVEAPAVLRPAPSGRTEGPRPRAIAVIGMAGRFPESPTLEAYWENLLAGRDLISPIPSNRWDVDRHSGARGEPNKTCAKHGGFLRDIERFDPDFFGIPQADAAWLDPQQRLVLEVTQELLDAAGYARKELDGTRSGVFLGGSSNEYVKANYAHQRRSSPHLILGTIQNMLASRVSHVYNLKGPAVVMDTACSSSLVAIHHACQSILNGESTMAVAGGVQLLLEPFLFIALNQAQMLSEDGRTRVFDRRASGMSLGEGVGLVLLKEHDRAVQDGDRILGTILGSAVNNDGRTMSMMMPSKEAQMDVVDAALRASGIRAANIGYLETHGSGNSFGDPVEIHSAAAIYRRDTDARQYCGVGSVKSNMGSLLQAGGVAALIKVLLAMQHRRLPPTIHCADPHPRFHFAETPFYPVDSPRDWAPIDGHRIGAVSSFGLGGTNAHLIVEGPHDRSSGPAARTPLPVTQFADKRLWLSDLASASRN